MPAEAKETRIDRGRLRSRARSMRMMPRPPRRNMKPEESPSMMYWPLTRPGRKTRGRTVPVTGSWVLPMPGGSTMTS